MFTNSKKRAESFGVKGQLTLPFIKKTKQEPQNQSSEVNSSEKETESTISAIKMII